MNESSSSFNNNACRNALRHVGGGGGGDEAWNGHSCVFFFLLCFSPTVKEDISPTVEYGNETNVNIGLAISVANSPVAEVASGSPKRS